MATVADLRCAEFVAFRGLHDPPVPDRSAILQTSNGTTVVPGTTISVIGRWRCP